MQLHLETQRNSRNILDHSHVSLIIDFSHFHEFVHPFSEDIMNRLTRTLLSRFPGPYLFVLLSIFRGPRYCCVTVNFHMGGGNKFCPDYLQRQSCSFIICNKHLKILFYLESLLVANIFLLDCTY